MSSENLVIYSLSKIPVSYMGEIVENTETSLVLQRVLVLMARKEGEVTITSVPYASRDAKITFDKKSSPGILIEGLDSDITNHYSKEIVAAYSTLSLVDSL